MQTACSVSAGLEGRGSGVGAGLHGGGGRGWAGQEPRPDSLAGGLGREEGKGDVRESGSSGAGRRD